MKCAVCGAENEASAAFCFRCGSALKPTPATGPTVNLSSAAADEPGARVYDVPAARSEPPAYAPPAVSAEPPSYAPPPPQYNLPQGQPGQPGYPPAYGGAMVQQQNNTALIALILGIVSFLGLSLLGAIPAVILGRNARKEIAASGGMMTGDGMAQAGIILGWINIALSVVGFCAFCVLPLILAAAGGGS